MDDIETFGDSEHPQSNGIPDQFDVLIRRIKLFGFHGFRRFIFHLPAGVLGVRQVGVSPPDGNGNTYPIYGGSTQSMNQFLGMPQWKRDYFLNPNGAWMQFVQEYATNTPDLEPDKYSIEVYIGGGFDSDDCYGIGTLSTTLNPDGSSNPHRVQSFKQFGPGGIPLFNAFWSEPFEATHDLFPLNPHFESHTAAFWREIKPWTDCGVRTIWLDASSSNTTTNPRRWGALEISHNPYLRSQGIRIGGETIPTFSTPNQAVDDCALAVMKWLANGQVIFTSGCDGTRPRQIKPIYDFNRANSEVHVADSCDGGGLDWEEWRAARARGFVVSMYFGKGMPQVELTKRWYSMGTIVVADFNSDGVVNAQDDADAYAATHPTIADTITVFATGDINEDGAINETDWTFWQLYRAGTLGPYRDYGGPNDM